MKTQSYILQIEDLMNLNLDRFLVSKNNHKNIREYEYIAKNISSIAQKAKNIENYLDFISIQIIVNDISKQPNDLKDKDIFFIESIEKIIFLKEVYENKLQKHILRDKKFLVTLIKCETVFSEDYYIFDYILKFSKYIKNRKINFSYINNNKKYCDYVKGAKKSLFNTIYGYTENKRIRKNRIEINCMCGTKHVIKEENLKQYFFKRADKLVYKCNQNHEIKYESKDFIFVTKYTQQEVNKLIIVPKYFNTKLKDFNFIKWISKDLRGEI